jgi:hypothetical protein
MQVWFFLIHEPTHKRHQYPSGMQQWTMNFSPY